jgi:Acyl-CoA dehydrogenase, N-terminal domain
MVAPFAEPLLPQLDLPSSPYHKPFHHALRATVRRYVSDELAPHAHEWKQAGVVPEAVRLRHCALGYAITHPIVTAADAGGVALPGHVPYDQWDTWCNVIVSDEISRMGYTGVAWGLGGGNSIGCPPIAHFGSKEQRERWLPRVARGELRFCLGIGEVMLRTSRPMRSGKGINTWSMEQRSRSPMAFGRIIVLLPCGPEERVTAASACWLCR